MVKQGIHHKIYSFMNLFTRNVMFSFACYVVVIPIAISMTYYRELGYFPAMAGISYLLLFMTFGFFLVTLKGSVDVRILIGGFFSVILPIVAAIASQALYGKGSGFLRNAYFHLIAYAFLDISVL